MPHLPGLSRRLIPAPQPSRERVLQFGSGNFLRAFAARMIDGANRQGLFDGGIIVVQATPRGLAHKLNEQDGLYTVLLRGVENGELREQEQLVTCVTRAIDPYKEYDAFLSCARNPDLRFIISNTTEAGIICNENDRRDDRPPSGFPAKMTLFLFERYLTHPLHGFVLLPCELIERNGDRLRHAILTTASAWQLERGFVEWVASANVFANTLVDGIVPGYPHDEAARITARHGYKDDLLVAAETFHFWAIEAPEQVTRELPLDRAGFNVVWTNDVTPYRERKVRILNGAHTSLALAAFLSGKDTVKQCMDDPALREYVETLLRTEVAPTLKLPQSDITRFIDATLDRFSNPFLRHLLLSISLNSVAKYKSRVLPAVFDYIRLYGRPPRLLAFALAALIAFYHGSGRRESALIGTRDGAEYRIQDDPSVLDTFANLWLTETCPAAIVDAVLRQTGWWGCDLRHTPGFAALVTAHLTVILQDGMQAALVSLRSGASSSDLA